uniref:Uncharacterized protein n=1 Tax=Octopus bimaculoides TaxID=37653 RepID=A0A0L8G9Z1_OCTBM
MSTSIQNKLNQLERRLIEENTSRERDRARNFDTGSSSGPRRPSRQLFGDLSGLWVLPCQIDVGVDIHLYTNTLVTK